MRRRAAVLVLSGLLLVSFAEAQIKIAIQGATPTPARRSTVASAAAPDENKPLNNEDVIGMASLGLSDDVIIDKICASKATAFDTSVNGLKSLKEHYISDAVIRVMIDPHASAAHENPDQLKRKSDSMPEEVGVYALHQHKLAELQKEVYEFKQSGTLKALGVAYGMKYHVDGQISNSSSPFRLSGPQEFIIKAPDLADISDYRLLRLDIKKNCRQFHQVTVGRMGYSVSWDTDKDDLRFTPQRVATSTWRVQLQLEKGEYAFYAPVLGKERSPDAKRPLLRIYTFGVD